MKIANQIKELKRRQDNLIKIAGLLVKEEIKKGNKLFKELRRLNKKGGEEMKKEFDLSDKIELWKLRFGIAVSQSPKFKELDEIIKEFIKIVERIIIERKSRRIQLIELKKIAGEKLI